MKTLVAASLMCCATIGGLAHAQTGPTRADEPHGGKRLLDRRYVTGTGATVDKPGVPQASGPTRLDRHIQRQDNKIDNSICKGCGK